MNEAIRNLYAHQARLLEQEFCEQCDELHDPIPHLSVSTKYCGPMYFCSEKCWDEWMQWGRYQREYEVPE